ncbi:MAG TPA: Nif3-like dinuclear metal center hexameric protein [Anaerolineae bacterium]|nr:Nif3-like dinuclear metal center hexameric protein [Anaerolineae bacterium]HQI84067.1 Nif3-like dinuclear metal center hexameric protein [Anaerolineae bacterium]
MTTTIQDVIDAILTAIPGAPLAETVDTFKSGDPAQPVTGIVTTFLASYAVIQRAAELGANLIITHEPTFYNHLDETEWLANDPVYQAKRALLDKHGIVVWRFHDHWHMHQPDGITTGVVRALGWEAYLPDDTMPLFAVPETTVGALAAELKAKLGILTVRVVGDLYMPCRRVGMMVGAAGGTWQINFMSGQPMDVLIAGEIHEWETCEYVRDAMAQGRQLALIVIGHANSEEPGMAYLVEWLCARVPDVPITHVPVGDPFQFV